MEPLNSLLLQPVMTGCSCWKEQRERARSNSELVWLIGSSDFCVHLFSHMFRRCGTLVQANMRMVAKGEVSGRAAGLSTGSFRGTRAAPHIGSGSQCKTRLVG